MVQWLWFVKRLDKVQPRRLLLVPVQPRMIGLFCWKGAWLCMHISSCTDGTTATGSASGVIQDALYDAWQVSCCIPVRFGSRASTGCWCCCAKTKGASPGCGPCCCPPEAWLLLLAGALHLQTTTPRQLHAMRLAELQLLLLGKGPYSTTAPSSWPVSTTARLPNATAVGCARVVCGCQSSERQCRAGPAAPIASSRTPC